MASTLGEKIYAESQSKARKSEASMLVEKKVIQGTRIIFTTTKDKYRQLFFDFEGEARLHYFCEEKYY